MCILYVNVVYVSVYYYPNNNTTSFYKLQNSKCPTGCLHCGRQSINPTFYFTAECLIFMCEVLFTKHMQHTNSVLNEWEVGRWKVQLVCAEHCRKNFVAELDCAIYEQTNRHPSRHSLSDKLVISDTPLSRLGFCRARVPHDVIGSRRHPNTLVNRHVT